MHWMNGEVCPILSQFLEWWESCFTTTIKVSLKSRPDCKTIHDWQEVFVNLLFTVFTKICCYLENCWSKQLTVVLPRLGFSKCVGLGFSLDAFHVQVSPMVDSIFSLDWRNILSQNTSQEIRVCFGVSVFSCALINWDLSPIPFNESHDSFLEKLEVFLA